MDSGSKSTSSAASIDFRPPVPSFTYRIAFILPWFGCWPVWMPLFWESCAWNPNIQWFIFTDQARPVHPPKNVEFFSSNLKEFYARLAQSLAIKIKPSGSYKLCDFKVTFGLVFQDLLEDFEFWGMCDLDMVWGHIRTFYTDDLLSQYDILTSSRYSINGQCTLFRNVAHVNNLFLKVPHAVELLQNGAYCGMDEVRINEAALQEEKAGELKTLRRRLMVSETWNFWEDASEHEELKEKGTLDHFPRLLGPSRWEEGRVYHCATGKEMVLHHFLYAKGYYAGRAWSYPYWSALMTGWEMNERDIVMRFKPGKTGIRWLHYFTTRLGATTWYRIKRRILKL